MADQFTEDEIAEAKGAFAMFDKDGSETITCEELGDVMRALGQNPTEEDLQEMISSVDEDKNGIVDFPEFLGYLAKTKDNPNDRTSLMVAFKTFDADGNGVISEEELLRIMTQLGDPMTTEDARAMIADADTDGNGLINYEEFVKIMSS